MYFQGMTGFVLFQGHTKLETSCTLRDKQTQWDTMVVVGIQKSLTVINGSQCGTPEAVIIDEITLV